MRRWLFALVVVLVPSSTLGHGYYNPGVDNPGMAGPAAGDIDMVGYGLLDVGIITGDPLRLRSMIANSTVTIDDYNNCATDTVTVTIDGSANVLTEGSEWTAATDNTTTAASLASAINALTGVSSTAAAAVATVVVDPTTFTILITEGDATCTTIAAGAVDEVEVGGRLIVADGAVGAPAIYFVSDTDTGIYTNSVGSTGFTAGGALTASVSTAGLTLYSARPLNANTSRIYDNTGALKLGGVPTIGHGGVTGSVVIGKDAGGVSLEVDGLAYFDSSVQVPDGTVGAPAVAFTSDADGTGTGIYRSAANTIGFATNGGLKLSISTSVALSAQLNANGQSVTDATGALKLGGVPTIGHGGVTGSVAVGKDAGGVSLEVDGTSWFDDDITAAGNLSMAGGRLVLDFDGDGNTYIESREANRVEHYAGGALVFRADSNQFVINQRIVAGGVTPINLGATAATGHGLNGSDTIVTGKLEVDGKSWFDDDMAFIAGKKLILDGDQDSNNYIYAVNDSLVDIAVENSVSLRFKSTGTQMFDAFKAEYGTGSDYWFVYNEASTQFELWTSDSNGAGADSLILSIDDGTKVTTFAGSAIVAADGYYQFAGRSTLLSPADGDLKIANNAQAQGVVLDTHTAADTLILRNLADSAAGNFTAGIITGSGNVIGANLVAGATGYMGMSTRSKFSSPADSKMELSNWAGNQGVELHTTSADTLTVRNLADSAGGTVNAANFTLASAATVDYTISAGGAILGPTAPAWETNNSFGGLAFAADAESVILNFEVPSCWDGASDLTLKIYWLATLGDVPQQNETVKWDISYRSIVFGSEDTDNGDVATGTVTYTEASDPGDDADTHISTITLDHDWPNQPITAGDTLSITFDRDVTGDTYTDGAIVHEWEISFQRTSIVCNHQ